MYKHYEISDDVFVDREEYIEWMNDGYEMLVSLLQTDSIGWPMLLVTCTDNQNSRTLRAARS